MIIPPPCKYTICMYRLMFSIFSSYKSRLDRYDFLLEVAARSGVKCLLVRVGRKLILGCPVYPVFGRNVFRGDPHRDHARPHFLVLILEGGVDVSRVYAKLVDRHSLDTASDTYQYNFNRQLILQIDIVYINFIMVKIRYGSPTLVVYHVGIL